MEKAKQLVEDDHHASPSKPFKKGGYMRTLEQRLERLERSLARWRMAACFATIVLFAMLVLGAEPAAKFVDHTGFRVINSTGAVQGGFTLGFDDDAGSSIILQGKDGSSALFTSSDITFFDAAGHSRVSLGLPSAELRAKFKAKGLAADDKPQLTFYDAKGNPGRMIR